MHLFSVLGKKKLLCKLILEKVWMFCHKCLFRSGINNQENVRKGVSHAVYRRIILQISCPPENRASLFCLWRKMLCGLILEKVWIFCHECLFRSGLGNCCFWYLPLSYEIPGFIVCLWGCCFFFLSFFLFFYSFSLFVFCFISFLFPVSVYLLLADL